MAKSRRKAPVKRAVVTAAPVRQSPRLAVPLQSYNDASHSGSPSRGRRRASSSAASGSNTVLVAPATLAALAADAADADADAADAADADADADADAAHAHAAHAHAAAAAAAAVVDDDDAHVAWAEAQKLRASSVLRSAVVVQLDLCSADVYVLASQAASFSACLLPTGLGVHIEVSEGGGTRELDVPMQLPPTSGLPVDAAFFSRQRYY